MSEPEPPAPFLCILILCFVLALCNTSRADEMIWFSAHDLSRGDVSLTLDPEETVAHQGIRVTTSYLGSAYVTMGLHLPEGAIVDSVVVCYATSAEANRIEQIRFASMTIPWYATVFQDIPVSLNSTTPTCFEAGGFSIPIEGSVSLSIRLGFALLDSWFDLGGIGIHASYPLSRVPEDPSAGGLSRLPLKQNHPNPFRAETLIEYVIESPSLVNAKIHDASGRLVRDLVREEQSAGQYHVIWDGHDNNGNDLPAGKYFYRVRVGNTDGSKGMVLIR